MKEYGNVVDFAWGKKGEPFHDYLEEHSDILDLFMSVLDCHTSKGSDDISRAMSILKEIWDQYPEEFKKYPELAIAVSLVWDKAPSSIAWSPVGQHKAIEPSGWKNVTGIEIFHYYVKNASIIGQRLRFMPIEYLALIVDHRSTNEERKWALKNYRTKRVGIGNIYSEIHYDTELDTHPRLEGKEFTLKNQKQYGGVCSCQADFADRVAKSIGVPAFRIYNSAGNSGGTHSWIMWIEVQEGNGRPIYSIENAGRFFNQNYYVGNIGDPIKDITVTDRQFTMKLYSIGQDQTVYRHSELVFEILDDLANQENWSSMDQWEYLVNLIKLNPISEKAWQRMARMVQQGEMKGHDIQVKKMVAQLLINFRQFPDFIETVFDDLISFDSNVKKKTQYYGKLCSQYEKAKRPDLSCNARIKYANYLVLDKQTQEALHGLANSCYLFPNEGNIVPKVLDTMDRIINDTSDSEKKLEYLKSMTLFYQQFLPLLKTDKNGKLNKYEKRLYERAISTFQKTNASILEKEYQSRLDKSR